MRALRGSAWQCRIKFALASVAAACFAAASSAEAQSWPRSGGETNNPQCLQASALAKAAFQSTNSWLSWPFDAPQGLGSTVVLRRPDKSGGLTSETKAFTSTSLDMLPTILWWQDQPRDGKRIAVIDQPFNWRGDTYSLYVLNAEASPVDLVGDFQTPDQTKRTYKPAIENSWNPPLVLTDDKTGVSWFIDMGEPYEILADWRVGTVSDGILRFPCTISFRPNTKSMLSLMPKPAQRLATLLDSTLGSGRNEGTLQPTATIRLDVADGWANASLRPWALADPPYNTREEVDDGLEQWASASVARAAIYENIRRQFRRTEEALTAYYQRRFNLPPAVAREMGNYVTDFMYREDFVFHSTGMDSQQSLSNPWPVQLR